MMHGFVMLVAEDDGNDRLLLGKAMGRLAVKMRMDFVENGVAAIEYLCGDGEFGDRNRFPFPDLLLLDIKLPGRDGFEVLQWVRGHSEIGLLPVVMLSSSELQMDVDRAHALGANAYVMKPCGLAAMRNLAECLGNFWAGQHRYPSCCRWRGLNSRAA